MLRYDEKLYILMNKFGFATNGYVCKRATHVRIEI